MHEIIRRTNRAAGTNLTSQTEIVVLYRTPKTVHRCPIAFRSYGEVLWPSRILQLLVRNAMSHISHCIKPGYMKFGSLVKDCVPLRQGGRGQI